MITLKTGDAWFESLPVRGYRDVSSGFLESLQEHAEIAPSSGGDGVLPNPLKFIINHANIRRNIV
jgi:hypothetical protein